jgi:hypothetical protein
MAWVAKPHSPDSSCQALHTGPPHDARLQRAAAVKQITWVLGLQLLLTAEYVEHLVYL